MMAQPAGICPWNSRRIDEVIQDHIDLSTITEGFGSSLEKDETRL